MNRYFQPTGLVKFCALQGMALLLSACSTLNYYQQAIIGHFEVLQRRQPIAELIRAETTDSQLKQRLATVQAVREFASRELALPDNASYIQYADLGREFVVWNVFAAPEFALEPVQSCFWLVGCLSYRGFFSPADAERYAEQLRHQGHDVYVGGVNAYSSLGWFADPVLNTMLKHSDLYLAGLIFHELAHQQVYVRDDSVFNESFASAVEQAGLERWLVQQPAQQQNYHAWQQRKNHFTAQVLATVAQLRALYALDLTSAEKRQRKQAALDALRQQFAADSPYQTWLTDTNNAKLLTVQTYQNYVPAFLQLLADNNGDFAAFYQQVAVLSKLDKVQRETQLMVNTATADKE